MSVKYTAIEIGKFVRKVRKDMRVSQKQLAMTANTGLRFISDLENGKETCELGKVLNVLKTLGVRINFEPPGKVVDES